MKTKYLSTVLFAFFMALILNTVDAQDKKIKVIKKADGVEDVQVFELGDELDEETLQLLKEKGIDIETLDVSKDGKIKIIIKDDDGETQEMEWNGEGEMPEGMEEHMLMLELDGEGPNNMMFIDIDGEGEDINIEVDVMEELEALENGDMKKKVKIKIVDDNGETKVMEWDGEGEMPEGMRSYMEGSHDGEKNVFIKKIKVCDGKEIGDDMDIHIIKGHDQGGVQIGVMIEKLENGVKVIGLVDGSDAENAGVMEEDVIQYLNDREVTDLGQLVDLVNENKVGDVVKLGVLRDGVKKNIDVELTEKNVKVIVKEVKCEWTEKDCKKMSKEECKKLCEKQCKKTCDPSKCTKEEMEKCKALMEEGSYVAPRNSLKVKDFKAYPNPSDGLINVNFRGSKDPVVVQVLDLNGKSLFKDTVFNFDGVYQKEIDLRDKIQGQVFISVIQNEKVYTEQVIVN